MNTYMLVQVYCDKCHEYKKMITEDCENIVCNDCGGDLFVLRGFPVYGYIDIVKKVLEETKKSRDLV